MSDLKYLQPGKLSGLPVDTFNRHNDATAAFERGQVPFLPTPNSGSIFIPWLPQTVKSVENFTPELLKPVKLGAFVQEPLETAFPFAIEAEEAESGALLGIVQRRLSLRNWVVAVDGACLALVNVSDEGHNTASVNSEGDLVSGGSGFDIVAKPSGTGEKRCFVKFGGVGLQVGEATGDVTARDEDGTPGTGEMEVQVKDEDGKLMGTGENVTFENNHLGTGSAGDFCQVLNGLLISIDCSEG